MMLLNLVPRQPAYSALEQYPPFGQLNSSTSINNQYMTSARNQNVYTDHLNGQDPFSTNAYEGERNMHSRKMCNTEMSHYIISKSAACIQGIYQDGPEEQNYVGNKDDSTNCVGENYTCVGKATEQSPQYDGCTKTIEENGKLQNGSHVEMVFTEDRPIVSEMKERKKSFEDFLEEQIRLEEQRASENQQECIKEQARHKAVVKKPFLRRGEGLARFRNANTKLIMPKESKVIPQIKVSGEWNTAKAEKPPLHRKTALVGNEQSCEIGSGTIKRPVQNFKGKTETILSISQKPALKNVKMKISPPLATEMQLDNKYNVNIKSTLRLENSNILENKENIENVIATKPNKLNKSGAKNQTASPGHNGRSSTHVKQPELSFEASFQKRQINWEKEKQKENFELDEFLLLEQAAEDLSFSSNSSFVQKLLDQNYQMDNSSSRLSSTPVKLMQQAKTVKGVGDANRRQHDEMQRRKGRAASQALPCVPAVVSEEPHGNSNDGIHSSSTIERKLSNPTEQLISKDECLSEDAQNGTITSKHKDFESNLCNNEDDIYEGSKAPSKDMNISTNNRDCDLDLSDGEGYNESTLVDVKNSLDEENPGSLSSNSSQVEFDDEQTWADLEEIEEKQDFAENQLAVKPFIPSDYTSRSPVSIPDITIKRKVATKKNDVLSNLGVIVGEQSPPPTSDLVMKLFPSLKPKQKPDFQFSNKSVPVQEDAGDIICSQRLREKLVELETEIERFKIENSSLARLREAQEKALENLKKEAADFEQQKAKELVQIEELKKKEIEKLQKERKVFEKYASAARAIPDKKEREEIQSLKQHVTDLQEELKRKEAKWSHNHGRLRNQIETLAKENADLREEIKFMEKVRLENWKKSEETESKKLVEGHGTQLRRSESISPPDLSKKGHKHCTPQPEKSIKIIHRSNSSLKGKASRNTKQAPSDSQRTKINLSESAEITSLLPEKNLMPIEQKNKINLIKGSNDDVQGEICYSDGKIERILKNGCHVILFPNGTAKEVSADGKSTTVTFFNGDVKQVLADQRVIYYYADAQTVHTAYPDGLEILQFSNGQTEKHFPDGKKEITFPDQTIKNLYKDGREESIFPDGTIITVQLDGSKLIEFDNGQRELHTTEFKRREYPDGTVKTVYSNGKQETKYASGRIRVKDEDGNILMDTKV